jgi:hypothetical protein
LIRKAFNYSHSLGLMGIALRTIGAAAVIAGLAFPAARAQNSAPQSGDTFNWSGRIPAGAWIRIRNLNGPITVSPATGDNVEVVATKHWRRGDPAAVRFTTAKFGPNDASVVICALWGDRSSCDEHSYDTHNDRGMRNNDVRVDFRVLVPKGVKVGVNTINGAVTIDGATSEIDAGTINGEVDVASNGGPVNASNVNGGVRARMGHTDSDADMEFTTVNGSVSVEFPSDFSGDVDLSTVNGSLNTNFAMTLIGRIDPKHLHAHIGKSGGPRLKLETVNGSVELRRQ